MRKLRRCFPIISCLLLAKPLQGIESLQLDLLELHSQQNNIETCIQQYRVELQEHAFDNFAVLQMFDETLFLWLPYFIQNQGDFDLHTLLKAVSFSTLKHQGQFRKDICATPYIIHPLGVARLIWEKGEIRNENILVAALLHDILEDTETTPDEIETLFGLRVRRTVEELTNDPNLTIQENKRKQVEHAPHLSLDAQIIKLADRLYNIRDLRIAPPNWEKDKFQFYLEWGQKLLDVLRGTNRGLEQALQDEILAQISANVPTS